MRRRDRLDALGGLDVLAVTPFVSGDARFLTRYFLPAHGRYRLGAYGKILAGLKEARRAADLALRGRLRRILGDDEGARRDFSAALKRDSRCADALAFRGEALSAVDSSAALCDLDRALRLEPSHRPARLWKAYVLACRGRLGEALAELDGLLSGGPCQAGFLLRGMLRERAEDLAGAEADYSAAIARDSRSPGLWTLRAAARCKRGDLSGAAADADAGLVLHPENLDGYVRILYLREGLKTAIDPGAEKDILLRAADRLLAEDPRCAWAHAARAGILGRSDLQIEGLRRAVALDPDNAWMHAFLGRALGDSRVGARREGLRALTRAASLAPKAGWMLCWRAEIRRQLKDLEGARADLDAGLALDPDYRLGFAWRSFLRDSLGDGKGAISDMTFCLEALPRTSFFHLRGEMRLRSGDPAGALMDAARCMSQSTPHALAYSGAGWLVPIKERRWKTLRVSSGELKDLSRKGPFKGIGLLWSARARLDGGRAAEALPLLDGALREEPGSFLAHCWRGEALCRLGRPRPALSCLDQALRRQPSFPPALLWRAVALGDLGRRSEALSILLRAHDREQDCGSLLRSWLRRLRPALVKTREKDGPGERGLLAELDLRAGRPEKASRLLEAVPLRRLGTRGLLARGLARARLGDWPGAQSDLAAAVKRRDAAAADFLSSLLKGVPHLGSAASALAHLALARAERCRGRAGEAERLLSVAQGLCACVEGDAPASVLALKSEALRLSGEPARAAAAAKAGLARQADCADCWFALGRALRHSGAAAGALAALRRAIRLDPSDGRIRAWEAEVLRTLGRRAEAGISARRAARAGHCWALALEGELRREAGAKEGVWESVRAALASDPTGSALAELLGAEPDAVRKDPACAWLYAWRGSFRRRQSRWREAGADFDYALRLDPACFWARALRGECRLVAGDGAGARADLDAVLSDFPAFAQARIWRGRALCLEKDFSGAYRDFQAALKESPEDVLALTGAGVCLENMGRSAEGRPYLLRASRLAPALFA